MGNWYNIPDIYLIEGGSHYNASKIEYKGRRCFTSTIEDTMYQRFKEDCENELRDADEQKVENMFTDYMLAHQSEVYELCDLALFPEHHSECDVIS